MRRRTLILASGAYAVLAAARASAQSTRTPRRIGWLSPFTPKVQSGGIRAFARKLKELGCTEGHDIALEFRFTEGKEERLATLARELVALKPTVILAASGPAVAVLMKETTTVPIVFANVGEPVERGFVASLARPGGNFTGTTFRFELMGKLVDLIRETLPAAQRIVLLHDDSDPASNRVSEHFQRAASALGMELSIVRVKQPDDLERAFAAAATAKADALIVPPTSFFVRHARRVAELAANGRLALFGVLRAYTDFGGLLSYYNDPREAYRRAAVLVDKILRGAKPGDLPVEEPERLSIVVNLRTATALGIRIPQSILLRADEVIE